MGLQQLLEDLLGLDSYIQVNKTLIQRLGLHEAILLSELYSERSYWRKQNKLRDDKWFFSTRDNLEENTGLTPYYQREALSKLITLGIVECTLMDTPAKKYYSIVDDKLLKALTACDESLLQLDEKGFNDINNNKIKTINTNNKKESTGAGALSKKHPRNFSKETLTDDLQSGRDIDEQKKSKKKSPKDKFRDECLDIIDNEYSEKNYSYTVKDLLVEYFEFVSAVPTEKENMPKRVKTVSAWKKKLDRLAELVKEGYDPLDIIQQSLDKKYYMFCPIESVKNKSTGHRECNQTNVVMSDPEYMRKRLEEDESEDWY